MSASEHLVTTMERLDALYARPKETSIAKELDRIDENYRAFIAAAPFVTIASSGPGGLECSPRGDDPGFVRVADKKTLIIPDRRGNNRLDTLRNLIADPRIALLFIIPGIGETIRVNGLATISIDPDLLRGFAVGGKVPATAIIVSVQRVYFQCSRAVVRAKLWDAVRQIDRRSLPSTGTLIGAGGPKQFDGEVYDRELPERVQRELY